MEIEGIKKFVKQRHEGQFRKQGTPYYLHPFAVCEILKEKGFGASYQVTGLLHDIIEDTNTTYEELNRITKKEIVNAVRILTKEKEYQMKEYILRISENPMAKMVKLADRIHNLEESILASKDFQVRYLKETQEYYIDLAKGSVFEKDLYKVIKKVRNFIENRG